MKLKSIKIKNYRSVEEISFETTALSDGTFTYGLIGVNEAGKSTILKALALKDGLKNAKGEKLPLAKDFRDKNESIEIEYLYNLEKVDVDDIRNHLKTDPPLADDDIDFSSVKYTASFEYDKPGQTFESLEITNLDESNPSKDAVEEKLRSLISKKTHQAIFWTAEDRYLISQPINLAQFSENPDDISLPLKNCFALAGISGKTAIKEKIGLISESTEREQLEDTLSKKVSKHINNAWPKHKIKITFNISDGLINFHVHDLKTTSKAKTADQRSDGFGQFVSFLLTISAQNKNDELSNTILLLDEPETHLHPQAQEDLLKELITITANKRNNIAFFATHSNYMIDKKDLSRNYKISKDGHGTEREQFDRKVSTYASVTYEVFEISSGDYHNQLYDLLREQYAKSVNKDPDEVGVKEFDVAFFQHVKSLKLEYPYKGKSNTTTLPTYVRNAIHYPENQSEEFEDKLKESIELLKSYES
ncbi:MAG: hypothetical protein CEO12_439 [Parcubacteria group bacterium Gr01-1014_46]|nr:MAG: hypothetical protein CEO12_439 [Parcubacteria group bacterium Gr01-1014_46]